MKRSHTSSSSLAIVASVFALTVATPVVAQAGDVCGVLPAEPSRIELAATPDEALALDLYDKAYEAYSRDDCHCTAWYNLEVYRQQPTAVLAQNIAAALERCGDLDAARRYAQLTLTLQPDAREQEDAHTLIARLDAILDGGDFVQVSLRDDYAVDRLEIGHVAYVPGDSPLLLRGTHPVRVDRGAERGLVESVQVPAAGSTNRCTRDTDCTAAGQRCELASGQCVEGAPPEEGMDPLLLSGIVTGSVGVALLITALALDAAVTPMRDDYDAMYDCLRSPMCGTSRGTVREFNALGDDIEALVTAEIGTLIAGGVLAAAGGTLLLVALLNDEPRAAGVSWGLSPLGPDGAWLDLQLRF